MNLGKQTITVFLDDNGRAILQMARIEVPAESQGVVVKVAETDDLGIWIQVGRG